MPYGTGNIGVGTNKTFKDNLSLKVKIKDCLLSSILIQFLVIKALDPDWIRIRMK